ncbi:MAG: hypothetical protein ABI678_08490 [Kofleriaceae bacterium]
MHVYAHAATFLLVLVLAACGRRGGGAPTRATIPTTVLDPGAGSGTDTVSYRQGPASFPIPKDASTVEDTPPDHTYKVERRQAEVMAELRVNLAQMGFKIEDEYVEDVAHTHWYITREAVVYRVSIAGDAQGHTLIILTID